MMPYTSWIASWYSWGVAIAFAVTFVTTLWIFFDSQSNGYDAAWWRWLSLLMAIVVIPSVVLSFFPDLALGLPAQLTNVLALAGMLATFIALVILLLYGLGIGVTYPPEEDEADGPVPFPSVEEGKPVVRATATPPRGVTPTTKEKPITPQRVTPTGNNTVRIKHAYEQELALAWLVVLTGPFAGQEFRLHRITDIGREPEHNDIVIDDRTISRQHARIRYEKGAFVIYDLASANGVFVNGERVQRRVLMHSDRIKLGQVMFGVVIVQEDEDWTPDEPDANHTGMIPS